MKDSRKQQLISAILMLAAGIGVAAAADRTAVPVHTPDLVETIPAATPSEATPSEATPGNAGKKETEDTQKKVRRDSAASLNLAYRMQDTVDGRTVSQAELIREELAERDAAWFRNIYQVIDTTPEQLAASVGRSPESLTGLYNPEDPGHVKEDPSTWKIGRWENIKVAVCDGDGNPISAYSNVKEIMSMASVFCFYNGPDNADLFREYAGWLWEQSHSYSLSMSDVYYCGGCQESAGTDGAETDGESQAEGIPDEILAIEGPGRDAMIAQYEESLKNGDSGQEGTSDDEENSAGEADSAAESSGSEESQEASSGSQDRANQNQNGESGAAQIPEGQDTAQGQENQDGNSGQETTAGTDEAHLTCPGHIDLYLTLSVKGLQEADSLFETGDPGQLMSLAAGTDGVTALSNAWKGWDMYNRIYAEHINGQDWEQEYGISVGREAAIGMPLSEAEVRIYMNMLPAGTSEERRKLINTALHSVGKIPYYWGGKPSRPGYDGNAFGSIVAADEYGRVMRGLDCSGWVNWVYWTATGQSLAYQGTDGLVKLGREISAQELKPGDLMIRLGSEAHVVMFLAWAESGEMIVIHESSDVTGGNVMVGSKMPDWPYFRSLLD